MTAPRMARPARATLPLRATAAPVGAAGADDAAGAAEDAAGAALEAAGVDDSAGAAELPEACRRLQNSRGERGSFVSQS